VEPKQKPLGWLDGVGLIVGIMLGTGIFTVFPKLAAARNPATLAILLAWVCGTAVALCGAFCFAELAGLFPKDGGEFIFLKEAYGRGGRGPLAFLFAWAQIFIIRPASLVSLSIILAVNVNVLGGGTGGSGVLQTVTFLALALFAGAALAGVRTSKWVQNVFTALKVGCLAVLIGVGLYLGRDKAATLAPLLPPADASWLGVLKDLGMALIPIMWVFGGWNEAPYIAEEMRNPAKDIPKALFFGVTGLGLLYVLINFVYVLHLGPAGLAASWTFASDLMKAWFGTAGERVMAATLVLSAAGAVNGLTVTGCRITAAFAEDLRLMRRREDGTLPVAGPVLFNFALAAGLAALVRCSPDSIDRLLVFTSGVVWIFFALVVSSVFIFRKRLPPESIPYKMPLYPATPLVFIAMCGFMLYGAWAYKPQETVWGILLLLAGVPVYFLGAIALGKARNK
jgi:amino acid transporter